MSADALGIVVETFVSVKRPVTSDGRIFNVTPAALEVEMLALNICCPVPPSRVPPSPILHAAPVPVALKLPLDWAEAVVVIDTRINAATADTNAKCFMISPPFFMLRESSADSTEARRRQPAIRRNC